MPNGTVTIVLTEAQARLLNYLADNYLVDLQGSGEFPDEVDDILVTLNDRLIAATQHLTD